LRSARCGAWPHGGPALQAHLAVLMKKHHGVLAVLAEVMLVITGLKSGVEVWRLARGEEHDPGAPMAPNVAMMIGKVVERVFESIPGAMLTAATLLGSANARSLSTLVSVVFACLATAFVATTSTYNFDTGAEFRRWEPAFYG
jgi:hypothetical protein